MHERLLKTCCVNVITLGDEKSGKNELLKAFLYRTYDRFPLDSLVSYQNSMKPRIHFSIDSNSNFEIQQHGFRPRTAFHMATLQHEDRLVHIKIIATGGNNHYNSFGNGVKLIYRLKGRLE